MEFISWTGIHVPLHNLKGIEVVENTVASVDVLTSGTYITLNSVICPLPIFGDIERDTPQTQFAAWEYEVAVSNDGEEFSSAQTLVVYDGTCIECDRSSDVAEESCWVKNGFCVIEGFCYPDGSNRPGAHMCGVCNSTTDKLSWSPIDTSSNLPPRITNLKLDTGFRVKTDRNFLITWSDPDNGVITPKVTLESDALTPVNLDGSRGEFAWTEGFVGKNSTEIKLTDATGASSSVHINFQVVACQTCECNFAMMYAYIKNMDNP